MNYTERFKALPKVRQHLIIELHHLAHLTCDSIDDLVKLAEAEKHSNWKYADPERLKTQIKERVADLEHLEFHMQKAWGFEENKDWHTWWCRPKSCLCPKLNNFERAGVKDNRINTCDCPLHGNSSKLFIKELTDGEEARV